MKNDKRLLSVLLVMCLLCCLCTQVAIAKEVPESKHGHHDNTSSEADEGIIVTESIVIDNTEYEVKTTIYNQGEADEYSVYLMTAPGYTLYMDSRSNEYTENGEVHTFEFSTEIVDSTIVSPMFGLEIQPMGVITHPSEEAHGLTFNNYGYIRNYWHTAEVDEAIADMTISALTLFVKVQLGLADYSDALDLAESILEAYNAYQLRHTYVQIRTWEYGKYGQISVYGYVHLSYLPDQSTIIGSPVCNPANMS